MTIEAQLEALRTSVNALTAAILQASGQPAKAVDLATGKSAVGTAPPGTTVVQAAAPKLNKDGETEVYTKTVKPVLIALVKTHGKDFALGVLAKLGFDHTGLLPIKAGERKEGEYAAVIAALTEAGKQPSPLAPIA